MRSPILPSDSGRDDVLQTIIAEWDDSGTVPRTMMFSPLETSGRVVDGRDVQKENRPWPWRDIGARTVHDVAVTNQDRTGGPGLCLNTTLRSQP